MNSQTPGLLVEFLTEQDLHDYAARRLDPETAEAVGQLLGQDSYARELVLRQVLRAVPDARSQGGRS